MPFFTGEAGYLNPEYSNFGYGSRSGDSGFSIFSSPTQGLPAFPIAPAWAQAQFKGVLLPPIDVPATSRTLPDFPVNPSWAATPGYVRDLAQQNAFENASRKGWEQGINNWLADAPAFAGGLVGNATSGLSGLFDDTTSALGNLLGSANYSAGFIPNGFMIGANWGNQAPNINLPGFEAGISSPYYGGGSESGIGFNSLGDLGRMFGGLWSDVKSVFSSVGNFFDNIFGGIGDFFSSIFPVALDLNGDGVQLTPVTSSNTFFDMAGDGYQHLTAWAAPGDALLAYDANNDGKIDQQNEIDFTQWDPTATSDMQALRDVFDTNHNGKLDSGDANFSQFKLIVSNADGTQTLQTLAQAGIASIDLIEDQTTRTFADGSSIDGQTSFTRTNGTTGTAATVTLVYDAAGAALNSTTTLNANGSTTIDNQALNADGSVANERILTTSADGKTKTLSVDLDGDGVIDQIQTSVTAVNANGSKTETVTDKTAGGVNRYKTVTRSKKSRSIYLKAA